MNIEEAKEALWDGQKITHERFLPHEFVFIENGVLWDEENNELNWNLFWSSRNNSMFENGWQFFFEAPNEPNFDDTDEPEFQCCDNCDLPDACADFGCEIKAGLRKHPLDFL